MSVCAVKKMKVAPMMKNLRNPTLLTRMPKGPLNKAVVI